MEILDAIKNTRTAWENRVIQHLARGIGVREDFRSQLDRFSDALEEAVKTGDPSWMDPTLALWATSLTPSDMEASQANLSHLLKELSLIAMETWQEHLPGELALSVITAVLPVYAYAFEKAAELEIKSHAAFISAQLVRTQQTLNRMEQSKTDFIAVAAHELKTPLTLVEGYAAMLRETFSSTDQGRLLVDGMYTGTHRLRLIVDDMIDVSLIDNNLMSMTFQPVWLNRLFPILKGELAESAANRCLTLEINSFPGSGEMTFGDSERLTQAFYNILANAIKYTPDGGKVKLDGKKLSGFMEITISDTGIGIGLEDQQIIFEKFGRLGNPSLHSSGKTKFKGGGPGLGLHIAKGIIEAHGGTIWVESPGYDEVKCPGATFHILIPMRTEPPDARNSQLFTGLIQGNSKDFSRRGS